MESTYRIDHSPVRFLDDPQHCSAASLQESWLANPWRLQHRVRHSLSSSFRPGFLAFVIMPSSPSCVPAGLVCGNGGTFTQQGAGRSEKRSGRLFGSRTALRQWGEQIISNDHRSACRSSFGFADLARTLDPPNQRNDVGSGSTGTNGGVRGNRT